MTSFGIKKKIVKFWSFLDLMWPAIVGPKQNFFCSMDLLEKVEPNLFAKEDKICSINGSIRGLGFSSKKIGEKQQNSCKISSQNPKSQGEFESRKNFAIQGKRKQQKGADFFFSIKEGFGRNFVHFPPWKPTVLGER